MSRRDEACPRRTCWRRAALELVATLTFSAPACSIDDREIMVSEPIPLLPDSVGFIDGSNAAGIIGVWYAYSDSVSCQEKGFSRAQCSMVFTPFNDGLFGPSDPSFVSMCTSGIVATVIVNPSTMMLDYATIWGAGIGLNLNFPPEAGERRPYDAAAHKITGVSFTINAPPPGGLQISFLTPTTLENAAYWGGRGSSASPVKPGLNVIKWADVGGPFYLSAPPPFDETKILAIQFHVIANPNQPTPYNFCISNLSALTD